MNFAEDFEIYKQNMFPVMYDHLARELGVKVSSIQQLGVGFYPAKQSWVFAERDYKGEIVGLSLRSMDGKKFMEPGSKRGLIYAYNENNLEGEERYAAGQYHWVRVQEVGIECPICGKPDWCMVSSDNPEDPSAVLCSRIEEGSVKSIGSAGYLHLRKHQQRDDTLGTSVLHLSDLPIPIVEGASDVLAALDLGLTAIGRPSAKGGMAELKEMPLAGKTIWILGENDAGAGKAGMQKTLVNLVHLSKDIVCVMPPEGVKDLRQWTKLRLTIESLTAYVTKYGVVNEKDPNLFADDIAHTIAIAFLDRYRDDNGVQTLRSYHGEWEEWSEGRYRQLDTDVFRGRFYTFLKGKRYIKPTKEGVDIVAYKPTKSKINDIIDALSSHCPVPFDPPTWIYQGGRPDTRNLIAFKNGLLDVDEYCRTGKAKLLDPTPDLFTLATLPYDYLPYAWSKLFDDYCTMTFNKDADSIRLLAQWFGYNLVFDTSQEKFMMFIGPTRSGKSTILSAMEAMLGQEQCGSTSLPLLANSHGLSSLIGKGSAIAGDMKGTIRKAEMDAALEVILRITGRDRIPINPKFVAPFDAELACRFTMAMNDLPMFTDHSRAIVARTLILNFPNSYYGREDFSLKNRLREEAIKGNLINFALWGLKDLREQGRFVEPEISKGVIGQFKELVSPITSFIEECCTTGAGLYLEKKQLYDTWREWCRDNDRKPGNRQMFHRWLLQQMPQLVVVTKGQGDDTLHLYKDIALKPWAAMKYLGRPM